MTDKGEAVGRFNFLQPPGQLSGIVHHFRSMYAA